MERQRAMHAGPFWSRAYGGYTAKQIAFAQENVGRLAGRTVVDPMSGQALHLSQWAQEGANLLVGDLNPGPLALAGLRAPQTMRRSSELVNRMRRLLDEVIPEAGDGTSLPDPFEVELKWLPTQTADELRRLGLSIGVTEEGDIAKLFNQRSAFPKFVAGICALAARNIATFRLSDNVTWLKPGGYTRPLELRAALERSMSDWEIWCRSVRLSSHGGSMATYLGPVTEFPAEKVDAVITSPPYANRLDYVRMWAPETAVVQAICGGTLADVTGLIGNNAVQRPSLGDLAVLPAAARRALTSIRQHTAWASESYYFPFFASYALQLDVACRAMAKMLRRKGTAVVFGRDTVRKDTLFPTADVVAHAFRTSGCSVSKKEGAIIRSHIGNLRVRSAVGLYGGAQREWWLVFKKR